MPDLASVNVVVLVGRVGQDPQILIADEPYKKRASFALATNELITYQGRKPNETRTTWHEIIAWGSRASLIQKLVKKGRLMSVKGKLRVTEWIDQHDKTRRSVAVHVETFTMLDYDPNRKKEKAEEKEDENKDAY